MCGIFTAYGANFHWISLENSFNKISYRGPDSSSVVRVNKKLIMAFHRLAIMGLGNSGNQPMKHPNDESLTLMCNGEIYNYLNIKKELEDFNFRFSTISKVLSGELSSTIKISISRTLKFSTILEIFSDSLKAVSYTHLTLPTKRLV